MAQDFAKRRSPKNKSGKRPSGKSATKTSGHHNNSQWAGFIWGLLCGILISSGAYFGILKPSAEQAPLDNTDIVQTAEPADETEADFSFYEYLRGAEVLVDVVPVSITREDEVNPVNYLLQAGSFQNIQDAETRRAKLILLNLEANIVPGTVSGRTVHRVQLGPFLGRNKTEDVQDVLYANNIDSYVLRMK